MASASDEAAALAEESLHAAQRSLTALALIRSRLTGPPGAAAELVTSFDRDELAAQIVELATIAASYLTVATSARDDDAPRVLIALEGHAERMRHIVATGGGHSCELCVRHRDVAQRTRHG